MVHCGQIVEGHYVPWLQRRGELGLDIGVEDLAVQATQTGHLGRRTRFVEEDQAMDPLAHERQLVRLPLVTRLAYVLALGL